MESPDKSTQTPSDGILNAATEEFANHGFSGARVDRIAERADVNKASIYYHVGNKKELYNEVLMNVLNSVGNRFEEIQKQIDKDSDSIRDTLKMMLEEVADHITEQSHYKIILSDVVAGDRDIPEKSFEQALANGEIFQSVFEQAKEEGVLRPDTSALTTYLTFFASVLFFSAMKSKIMEVSALFEDSLGSNLKDSSVPPELMNLIFEGILEPEASDT